MPTAGKPETYICDCPVQKGQERIWQFVKQPLSDQLILVMGQDVTEEHLVAKELAAKKRRFNPPQPTQRRIFILHQPRTKNPADRRPRFVQPP